MSKKKPFHFVLKGSCAGSSMDPLIKPTAKLEICVRTDDGYEIGDIVVFIQHSLYVAHRIISVNHKGKTTHFTLKGDNNSKIDGVFTNRQIIGKVHKIFQNKYIIDLEHPLHGVLKYLFVLYSILNTKNIFIRIFKLIRSNESLKLIFHRLVYTKYSS